MPKIAVITPATGRPQLRKCATSVARQSFRDLEHIVVIDGAERTTSVLRQLVDIRPKPTVLSLPTPTGRNNYNGHRIYGALPYLTDATWVAYLDEDNWLEKMHFAQLVELAESHRLQWAYALRKIVTWSGRFVCYDNCNSLGWWPAFDGGYHHVDTNCFFLQRSIAVQLSALWYRRSGLPDVETADRTLCMQLLREYPLAFTTGQYSVNYRIGSRSDAANAKAYYLGGNAIMASIYKQFPWASLRVAGALAEHPCLGWEHRRPRAAFRGIYSAMWQSLSPLQPNSGARNRD